MPENTQPSPQEPVNNSTLPRLRHELRSWTRDLAVALGLALVIIKFVYRFTPIERGDVVVFWYPLDHSKSFIKRVIGLPGETIELRASHLYVDGKELVEPYVPASYL